MAGPGAETPTPPQPTPPTPPPQPTPPPPPPAPPAAPSADDRSTEDQRVPYDRFKEVNDENKRLKKEADERAAAEEERKRAEMSEVEKAKADAAKAKEEAEQLKAEKITLEKSGWVKAEAQKLNAHNPADVVLHVDLAKLDDEASAKEAVAALAKDGSAHSYLFGKHSGPQPIGGPLPAGDGGGDDEPSLPTKADGTVDEEEATRQFGQALGKGLGLIRQR